MSHDTNTVTPELEVGSYYIDSYTSYRKEFTRIFIVTSRDDDCYVIKVIYSNYNKNRDTITLGRLSEAVKNSKKLSEKELEEFVITHI